jgi:protein-tyrosine phosphatase
MDWITSEIALGDIDDSRDPEGVDAVLNVAAEVPVLHNLPYLHLKIDDQRPLTVGDLKQALRFLTDRTSVGQKVLVHCYAGTSRSPAIVAAFLCATTGISEGAALALIREKRWKADPDPVVWESILTDGE